MKDFHRAKSAYVRRRPLGLLAQSVIEQVPLDNNPVRDGRREQGSRISWITGQS
jgi:hypothetical protein